MSTNETLHDAVKQEGAECKKNAKTALGAGGDASVKDIQGEAVVPQVLLGMGMKSLSQMGTNTFCVDQTKIVYGGQPIAQLKFGTTTDITSFKESLDISGDLKLNIKTFSGEVKGNYATDAQKDGYSLGYTFSYDITFPAKTISVSNYGHEALNQFGRSALSSQSSAPDLDKFYRICGDKFAVQEKMGAKLFAMLEIKFNSESDKKTFGGSFKGSLQDIGELTVSGKYDKKLENIKASVELSAFQEGGDVLRLAKIFGAGNENSILKCGFKLGGKSSIADYNGIDDSETSLANCVKVIDDIINYAKNDFVNQIDLNNITSSRAVPSSREFVYMKYEDLGVGDSGVIPDSEVTSVMNTRALLTTLNQDLTSVKAFVQALSNSNTTMSMEYNSPNDSSSGVYGWSSSYLSFYPNLQLQKFYKQVDQLNQAIESKSSGALQCYFNYKMCDVIKENICNLGKNLKLLNENCERDTGEKVDMTLPFQKAYAMIVGCKVNEAVILSDLVRVLLPNGNITATSEVDNKTTTVCESFVEHSVITTIQGESAQERKYFNNIFTFCTSKPDPQKEDTTIDMSVKGAKHNIMLSKSGESLTWQAPVSLCDDSNDFGQFFCTDSSATLDSLTMYYIDSPLYYAS